MTHQLKLFFDKALKKPVTKFEFPRTDLGDDAYIDFYIHNASEKWPIVIIPEKLHPETEIIDLPQNIPPLKTVYCKLKWTPSLESEEPLTTITSLMGDLQIG